MTDYGGVERWSRRRWLGVAGLVPFGITAAAAQTQTDDDGAGADLTTSMADPALPGIVLERGIHRVTANTTVRADVMLMPGARIDVAAGKTLTLLGDLRASVGPLFTGGGRVDLNRSRVQAAFPEWWGAVADDSSVDSLPALMACVDAHSLTQLRAGAYFISNTWAIERSHRRVRGAGFYGRAANEGTRIVTTGTGDAMRVGTIARPGSVNQFVQGVDVRCLELGRTRAAAPPPRGREASGAAGLRIAHVLMCEFTELSAPEHINGYAISGAVRTHMRNCLAFRSPSGGTTSDGVFRGFLLDGNADVGLAGGNASLFLIDCNVSTGGAPPLRDSVGALLDGAFADSVLVRFETAGVATGIRVAGGASRLSAGRRRSGHANLHITMPIIDQCTAIGIDVADTSDHALIDISDAYVGLGPRATAAISLQSTKGQISIDGGQLIGWFNAASGGDAAGLIASNADGFSVSGTKFLGCRVPVKLDQCRDFDVNAAINNPSNKAIGAAITVRACTTGRIAARIKGQAAAFASGIACEGNANRALSLSAFGVDSATVIGGAANRVVINGRSVASSGRAGSIEVSGLAT